MAAADRRPVTATAAPGLTATVTVAAASTGLRPLSARSVLVSTLLGTDPPALPVARLVRVGALFEFSEGSVRTALSRLATAGDVERDERGWYRLSAPLRERQARQSLGRSGRSDTWSGRWRQAVVRPGARTAGERAELRAAMQVLRFGELRDGVWLRPDNLPSDRAPAAMTVVADRCHWSSVAPDRDDGLADELWDLAAWATRAAQLRRAAGAIVAELESGDERALRPGFELSAAVLRHFVADPLLPHELLPRRWPGDGLRATYDRFDVAYRRLLREWLRASSARTDGSTVTA